MNEKTLMKIQAIVNIILALMLAYAIIQINTCQCAESINESIIIAVNNSTDWRTNLSACCEWMG